MEQETQQQPQENSQEKLLWKSPSGWRYYSPAERSRWPPTGRRALTIIAIVIALVSLSLLGHLFGWGLGAEQSPRTIAEQSPWVIGLVVTFLIAVITLTFSSLREWLGFGRDGEKSGLDLLQFLVTATIPIIVALGGIWFTDNQNRNREAVEEQRAQDEALQAYFEEMGNLLLDEDLPNSEKGDEASTLARARTLAILGRADPERKSSVVRFLYESNLIQKDQPVVSLASADLREVDLSDAALSDADLREANLSEADLSGADLRDAALSGADLRDGVDVDALGANLQGADLSDADLTDAYMSSTDLRDADLIRTDLRDADLRYADLRDSVDVDALGADLSDADLRHADLRHADLSALVYPPVPYWESADRGAHLQGADLRFADLREANLTDAYVSNAKLNDADLTDTDLRDAALIRTVLFRADLDRATLSDADLREANLSEADLRDTDLSDANLLGADLTKAEGVTIEYLEQNAKFLRGATMPDGTKHN